eukprot:102930-Chlamydomonas_euryale.AAC.6
MAAHEHGGTDADADAGCAGAGRGVALAVASAVAMASAGAVRGGIGEDDDGARIISIAQRPGRARSGGRGKAAVGGAFVRLRTPPSKPRVFGGGGCTRAAPVDVPARAAFRSKRRSAVTAVARRWRRRASATEGGRAPAAPRRRAPFIFTSCHAPPCGERMCMHRYASRRAALGWRCRGRGPSARPSAADAATWTRCAAGERGCACAWAFAAARSSPRTFPRASLLGARRMPACAHTLWRHL